MTKLRKSLYGLFLLAVAAVAVWAFLELFVRTGVSQMGRIRAAASAGALLGCMAGAADVRIPKRFAAGTFAEHLTSFAAAFDRPTQTKAVKWLRGGAGFTSGTVAEPYALWQKFPNAWIFPRMLDGATALERNRQIGGHKA